MYNEDLFCLFFIEYWLGFCNDLSNDLNSDYMVS